MAGGKKYYVVWAGRQTGVFDTWAECEAQIKDFKGAKYRSFPSETEATMAFREGYKPPKSFIQRPIPTCGEYELESIAVDASCLGNPGKMEYRGVYVRSGQELFRVGPFEEGTNNIGEFLALVHGLALLKQKQSRLPIYADSITAIAWVRQKRCKSKLERTARNEKIFELIERAEKWLAENSYTTRILKWETAQWGEIPADFGRK